MRNGRSRSTGSAGPRAPPRPDRSRGWPRATRRGAYPYVAHARAPGSNLPFPPGTASPPCPARDVRPPPRVSPLRGIALWKPQPAQPPRSQRAERGLAERMRSPARRVPLLAHLSSTCCGPIHLLLAVLQASPPEASPRPHLSYLAASHSACAAACSALHVRPAAATHLRIPVTLSASLCAPAAEVILPICGHLWAPSLSCLAPDRVARARCAYVRLGGGNRSRPLPHCGSG